MAPCGGAPNIKASNRNPNFSGLGLIEAHHRRTPVPGCRGDGHGSSRRRFRCRCRPCSVEVGKLTVIDDRNGGTLFGFDNADGNPWVVQQIRACRAAVDSGLTRSLSRELDCRTALLRLNWGCNVVSAATTRIGADAPGYDTNHGLPTRTRSRPI
jgi:hypothetical protein